MISLIFKILGDATGFKRTVNKEVPDAAREAGKKAGHQAGATFGKEFGQQLKSGIMMFVGAGAIIAAIRKEIEEATKLKSEATAAGIGVEEMQMLEKAAELTGMTVKEIQKTALLASESFVKLMEAVQGTGGIMDKATVELLVQAGQDLKEVSEKMAPAIVTLVKGVNMALGFFQKAVEFGVGAAYGVKGVLTGNKEDEAIGDQLMADAWNAPTTRPRTNAPQDAADAYKQSVKTAQANQARDTNWWLKKVANLSNAQDQRDLAQMQMVPGMSKEMLDALNEMSQKLTNIDQNLVKKL
jgi:hypothetical protein